MFGTQPGDLLAAAAYPHLVAGVRKEEGHDSTGGIRSSGGDCSKARDWRTHPVWRRRARLCGRIVKHLKPADVADSANAAKQVAVKALAVAKENKKLAVGALVVAGVAAVGGAAYGVVSHIKHRKALEEQKGAMDAFNVAFTDYLSALDKGKLTVETIDGLETAMDGLGGEKGFTVEIEGDQFMSLVEAVRDYTDRFAKANGMKPEAPVLKIFDKRPNDLGGLRDCLATQREILPQAA